MRSLMTIITLVLLTSCSAIDMEQYASNTPRLDLFEYFNGHTRGWGIVQDRKGVLTRSFIVDITGEMRSDGNLTLHENFHWNDGEKSQRTWVLLKLDEHSYVGTAGDVIGSATGSLYGNALNWQYYLNLKVNATSWKLKFDDWMFLLSNDLLLNKATMSKFGLKVGEVTIIFRK